MAGHGVSRGWSPCTGMETKGWGGGIGRGEVLGTGLVLRAQSGEEGAISLYGVSLLSPRPGPGRWGPAHRGCGPEDAAR